MFLHGPGVADVAPCIQKRQIPLWKRALDAGVVVLIAPLIAPLLALVAIYIKLVSRGPVLFVQPRVGYGGDDFLIYKFRTMHVPEVSRDENHRQCLAHLSRTGGLTKKPVCQTDLIFGGALLRRLSIDELPQLLNVMQGNMSLVGPRPDVLHLEDYQPWQTRRFEVLPGMTGLWQVSGKNRLTFDQMIRLDIEYVETQSLARDLRIMAKTIVVLLSGHNE